MPSFTLNTNLPKDKIPPALLTDLSKLIAKICSKPESYVAVRINADQMQTFAGTTDPCATGTLELLGSTNTKQFTKEVNGLIHERLGIEYNRIFTFFYDLNGSHIGHGQSTFG